MLIGPCEGLLLNKHWIDSNYIKKQLMHCTFSYLLSQNEGGGKKVEMVILQTVIWDMILMEGTGGQQQ